MTSPRSCIPRIISLLGLVRKIVYTPLITIAQDPKFGHTNFQLKAAGDISFMSIDQQTPSSGDVLQLIQFRPQLINLAHRLVSPKLQARVDPSDVVQETLLTAAKSLPSYNAEKVPILAWLFKLLRQRIIDAKRKHLMSGKRSVNHEQAFVTAETQQNTLDGLPAQYQSRPPSEFSALTRLQQLETALRMLDEETQLLLRLRYFESLSLAEIAEQFRISMSAVKMRHMRAIQELRKALDNA